MVQSKVIHMLFQSTFPRGERRSLLRDPLDSMHFNPRSHVGNDRLVYPVLRLLPYFNPRSHVGNDQFAIIVCICVVISIHVPTWGTTGLEQTYTDISSFQSTFPRGERRFPVSADVQHEWYFNPRSHVGNDWRCL